ncbi:MAG: alpha/beta hydrolase [Actinomycetia bacterium]|nr:alpha/beta hydrolase [Actinomycetes bacterium]
MPPVLVHGNPETSAIWGPMIDQLDRDDVICLSPPGFGAPTPDGWGATRQDYLDWLIAELEAIDGPIDLFGHDWGGGHVMGVAMTRPGLVRSWGSDVAGIFHADYEWHEAAQAWQTPEVGEQVIEMMVGAALDDRVASFVGLGMPEDIAHDLAAATDAEMGRCILALYRSATKPVLQEQAAHLDGARAKPGLVVRAQNDDYVGTDEMSEWTAEQTGAQLTVLTGVGHWWMIQDPAAGAAALTTFWSSLQIPRLT